MNRILCLSFFLVKYKYSDVVYQLKLEILVRPCGCRLYVTHTRSKSNGFCRGLTRRSRQTSYEILPLDSIRIRLQKKLLSDHPKRKAKVVRSLNVRWPLMRGQTQGVSTMSHMNL